MVRGRTLDEIKDAQKHEVSRVCFELNLSVLQQDVVERMSMMLWEKAYKLGLESGWAYEQDNNRMQRDED